MPTDLTDIRNDLRGIEQTIKGAWKSMEFMTYLVIAQTILLALILWRVW